MVDASIIIVSWNTKDILYNCLKSIYAQPTMLKYEVIVIDNASTDGSTEMVSKDFPQVILLKNAKNKGFAAANNQGIAIVEGRYVLLLNSDTIILDDAVSKTVSFADNNPDAAVVGCRVLNPDKTLQFTCFMFPSLLNLLLSSSYLYKLFPRSRIFGRERMTWWDRSDPREVDVVAGCFMLVRRKAVEQVGTMDEQFFMYGEESDWCYRCKQAGWKVLFTPTAEIIHLGQASSKQKRLEMILQLRISILLFIKKHKSRFIYYSACLVSALSFFLRAPYWLAVGIVNKKGGIQALQIGKTYLKVGLYCLVGCTNKTIHKDIVKGKL